jgi:hypothetical protein
MLKTGNPGLEADELKTATAGQVRRLSGYWKTFCLPFISGKEKSMLSENQQKLFADFHKSVEAEGILDEKTSHLIKVAAAMAFGCYP